jgi:hypothetical protein
MRALPVILLLLVGCEKKAERPRAVEAPKPTKITHFYGNAVSIARGETLTLCYGSDNATTVSITPPIDKGLKPSLNRCISDTPTKDTTYTLKAGGPGGDVTETLHVKVGAAQAGAPASRQLIKSFNVMGETTRQAGSKVQLCYSTEGAIAVSSQPAATAPLGPGKNQCYFIVVDKTTTIILTATAADGAVDRMQVGVPVQ